MFLTHGEEGDFAFALQMVALRAQYPEARAHQPGAGMHREERARAYTVRTATL